MRGGTWRSTAFRPIGWRFAADVAQLVERELPKLEVAGSRPVVRFHSDGITSSPCAAALGRAIRGSVGLDGAVEVLDRVADLLCVDDSASPQFMAPSLSLSGEYQKILTHIIRIG